MGCYRGCYTVPLSPRVIILFLPPPLLLLNLYPFPLLPPFKYSACFFIYLPCETNTHLRHLKLNKEVHPAPPLSQQPIPPIHTHTHAHTHTLACTRIHTRAHTHIHTMHTHARMHTHTHARAHTHRHTHARARAHTQRHVTYQWRNYGGHVPPPPPPIGWQKKNRK